MRYFFLFLCLLSIQLNAEAQQTNPCGLRAEISPSSDITLAAPTNIQFQNIGTGYTSYKFLLDGFDFFTPNAPLNLSFNVGLSKVQLVVSNGICTDTATVYVFVSGQFPADTAKAKRVYGYSNRNHSITGISALQNTQILVHGIRNASSIVNESQMAFLFKTQPSGCVLWGKKFDGPYYLNSKITNSREAADGSIYLSLNYAVLPESIVKMDAVGNILWTKSIGTSPSLPGPIFNIESVPDGGLIFASTNADNTASFLTRLSPTGAVIWRKQVDLNSMSRGEMKNILVKGNAIYYGGTVASNNNTEFNALITKIDLATGATLWLRKYLNGTEPVSISNMVESGNSILISLNTSAGIPNRPNVGGILKIDTDGQVLTAKVFTVPYTPNTLAGPYINASSQLVATGNYFYILTYGGQVLSLQGDGFSNYRISLDSTLQFRWAKANGGVGQPKYFYTAPFLNQGVVDAGIINSPGFSTTGFGQLLHVNPVDSSGDDPNSNCKFYDPTIEEYPVTITSQMVTWTTDQLVTTFTQNHVVPVSNYFPEMRYNCPDYVDSCSILKVEGAISICNINKTYTYKSHKNKNCGQPTAWQLSSQIQLVSQTDSSVTVKFNSMGRHVIYGRNILSCIPVEDSIVITAESSSPPLELGPNQQICPANTTTIHAGSKFFSYLWSNGSTDSVITINQPGKYWVLVKDSCDNEFSDTVIVSQAPPIPFSIGPDRVICAGDTVELNATSGFLNYAWSPSYRIDATSSQKVVVNPLVDTVYSAIAEKTPGCFAYDTVRINVNQSTPISLGPDKSFCSGDSALITPGGGFNTYLWNNGSAAASLIVKSLGSYSVMVTNNFGCKSYDTLQVTNVFALPKPVLDKNSILCEATTRTLDAGAGYQSYAWNTGANSQTIAINGLGVYAVQVTDNNGCKGTDTTRINFIQTNPAAFLPADTAICVYEKLTIKPATSFSTYLWNDGTNSSSLLINKTGNYWLKVSDQYGCIGTDSIAVTVKTDCLVGIFVPSAFTPNRDGKNDLFKPTVYGKIVKYEFLIYNRWGTIVFRSTEINQGWDGKLNRQDQSIGGYVWVVNYQFEGQPAKQQKGTVVLIR